MRLDVGGFSAFLPGQLSSFYSVEYVSWELMALIRSCSILACPISTSQTTCCAWQQDWQPGWHWRHSRCLQSITYSGESTRHQSTPPTTLSRLPTVRRHARKTKSAASLPGWHSCCWYQEYCSAFLL